MLIYSLLIQRPWVSQHRAGQADQEVEYADRTARSTGVPVHEAIGMGVGIGWTKGVDGWLMVFLLLLLSSSFLLQYLFNIAL